MGQSDRTGMTTGQKVAAATAILVVLLVTAYLFDLFPLGDEPPIRVRNGSIEIHLTASQWEESDSDNTNEPDETDHGPHWYPGKGKNQGKFWVKVTGATASVSSCGSTATASGTKIDLSYSGGGGVRLRPGKKKLLGVAHPPRRTRVRPKAGLVPSLDRKVLKFGANPDDYISEIKVKGTDNGADWTCTFNAKEPDLEIYICSSSGAQACK